MSIGPVILPGRLPASLLASRLSQNLHRSTQVLAQLQDQVATGQKFFVPGESPAAALRTITLQKLLERKGHMQAGVATQRSLLHATETSLQTVSDALGQARAFALAGIGDTVSESERQALATEVGALLRGVVNAANAELHGRYLFGGSQSLRPPFEMTGNGVLYHGDGHQVQAFADLHLLISNNVDGHTAFGAGTQAITRDVNPALSLDTRIADLHGGFGVELGAVRVTLDDGISPQTQSVDLAGAETVADLKTRLEAAFAAGPLTLAVDIDPATGSGLRLTPSAGTAAVADLQGSSVAAQLGIASPAAAVIEGGDLDPRLTLATPLADLNGGTGIGPTAGNGLRITSGTATKVVDISSAVTVEDLFNILQSSGLNLETRINDAGNGLSVTSRLSGAPFAIGENNGQNATLLGIRTLAADTRLADLNRGSGLPLDQGVNLEILRRDGSTASIDLSGARTVQDVLDALNAVDPGVLTASLNAAGNGITLVDDDGASTGPLTVVANAVSTALGLDGSEPGGDPAVPLVGRDVHPQHSTGILGLLVELESALTAGDNQALERLAGQLSREADRFNVVRADVGSRLKLLEQVENRLLDEELHIRLGISEEFDADLTEVITRVAHIQATLEATLRVAAQTSRLSLLNFL